MIYTQYREKIKAGDLLAWETGTFTGVQSVIPSLVSLATKSPIYHVAIALPLGERVLLVEAMPPAVRIWPLSKKDSFYHVPMNLGNTDSVDESLLAKVGEDYSLWKAFLTAFVSPTIYDGWHCALLAKWYYLAQGLDIGEVYTPGQMLEACETISGNKRVKVHV